MSAAEPDPHEVLEWVIVGGGIHGTHLAARLLGEGGVAPEALRIVDPGPELLHVWRTCTTNTGMRHLRSPPVHHLGLEPFALLHFAGGRRAARGTGLFARPYNRPSVDLFAAHCADVLSRYGLPDLHRRDRAVGLDLNCDAVRVRLGDGHELVGRRVLLALGAAEQPRWPNWARELHTAGARVHHVFDSGFTLEPDDLPERVAVIGGGITAAQVAMRLVKAGARVDIVSPHAPRVHEFDSDPGWMGPKHMRRFAATRDPDARRALITQARHRGSIPPRLHRALRAAMHRGDASWHVGQTQHAEPGAPHRLHLHDHVIEADAVLLATGFEARRPGGTLVDELIESHALPCASCGYPVVDHHLRWHPRVFVTGPLAELEVGPVARNILGARRAAERILSARAPT